MSTPHLVPDRELLLRQGKIPADWFSSKNPKRAVHFIPLDLLRTGPENGFVQILSKYWWSIHPVLGAIMAGPSAQCNSYVSIQRKITADLYPGADTVFVEKAFVPIDPRDWR